MAHLAPLLKRSKEMFFFSLAGFCLGAVKEYCNELSESYAAISSHVYLRSVYHRGLLGPVFFFLLPLSLGDAWGSNGKWWAGAAGFHVSFLATKKVISERYPYYK